MCTIAIEPTTSFSRTSCIKLYKNTTRSRIFCRIAKRSIAHGGSMKRRGLLPLSIPTGVIPALTTFPSAEKHFISKTQIFKQRKCFSVTFKCCKQFCTFHISDSKKNRTLKFSDALNTRNYERPKILAFIVQYLTEQE